MGSIELKLGEKQRLVQIGESVFQALIFRGLGRVCTFSKHFYVDYLEV